MARGPIGFGRRRLGTAGVLNTAALNVGHPGYCQSYGPGTAEHGGKYGHRRRKKQSDRESDGGGCYEQH